MSDSILTPFPTVILKIAVQATALGRCESVCDMSPGGYDPHFCAFMEHATGRHQCSRCGADHTWGPMRPAFPPSTDVGPDAEPGPLGNLLDEIERTAADHRYQARLADGTRLAVAVPGGIHALVGAAVRKNGGMAIVSEEQIRHWLEKHDLDLISVQRQGNEDRSFLIYEPGVFVKGDTP